MKQILISSIIILLIVSTLSYSFAGTGTAYTPAWVNCHNNEESVYVVSSAYPVNTYVTVLWSAPAHDYDWAIECFKEGFSSISFQVFVISGSTTVGTSQHITSRLVAGTMQITVYEFDCGCGGIPLHLLSGDKITIADSVSYASVFGHTGGFSYVV